VEQAAEERAGVLSDELVLPGFEHDRAGVLSSWTVLGEEARPVLREALDGHAAGALHDGYGC
jgi:hypothetical protein